MSSFRDKINSKLNINLNPTQSSTKSTQQNLQIYDETYIKIKVIGGQSQLCSIKLDCTWALPNITNKCPQLKCTWFNKTQSSMTLIEGVNGSYYQPCLSDIGTIIHVQCTPQLPGIQYQGMPISKQIGPIKIDNQTEQQANDLLSAGKATFSIKIKNLNMDAMFHEGLIKIQGNIFRVISKLNQQQKQLMNIQISQNNLLLKCIRNKSRELEIQIFRANGREDQKLTCQVSSNKIRDVLILLVKLIAARNQINIINKNQEQQRSKQKQENRESLQTQISSQNQQDKSKYIGQNKLQKIQEAQIQKSKNSQSELTQNQNTKILANQQQKQQTPQLQKQQSGKDNQSNSKNSQKSQKSEEQLQNDLTNNKKVNSVKTKQIKSSQDLSTIISSPKKSQSIKVQAATVIPHSHKQNALQVLQIADLKKQLRANQTEILQLKKTINQKNEIIQGKDQQISRMKQRQANLSCNYFQLEDQIKKIKDNSQKSSQQVSYYRNQNRILKTENQNIVKKNKVLTQDIIKLEQKLAPFLHQTEQQQKIETYQQLKQKYQQQVKLKQQLQAKYQYAKEQALKIQQKYNEVKQSIDEVQGQKNFYKKKYQNISQQLQSQQSNSSTHTPITSSPASSKKMVKLQSIKSKSSIQQFKMQQQIGISPSNYNKMQGQILDLKRQLKQSIQQNNFLRSINAVSSKDKKSSSKQHLKLQLAEMKKIVNRLTQAVTQKDFALENMKNVSKQITQKLLQATRKLQQYQKGKFIEQHTLKHNHSIN